MVEWFDNRVIPMTEGTGSKRRSLWSKSAVLFIAGKNKNSRQNQEAIALRVFKATYKPYPVPRKVDNHAFLQIHAEIFQRCNLDLFQVTNHKI